MTTETKWTVHQGADYTSVLTSKDSHTDHAVADVYGETAEEALQHAHLIAAAPDQNQELQELRDELQSFLDAGTKPSDEWLQENIASIDAILAEARGES